MVSAGYSHHHSQPHPAGTTTKSVAYSLSVARLSDGFGVAIFSPTAVTAAANILCQGLGFCLLLPSPQPTPSRPHHHQVSRLLPLSFPPRRWLRLGYLLSNYGDRCRKHHRRRASFHPATPITTANPTPSAPPPSQSPSPSQLPASAMASAWLPSRQLRSPLPQTSRVSARWRRRATGCSVAGDGVRGGDGSSRQKPSPRQTSVIA